MTRLNTHLPFSDKTLGITSHVAVKYRPVCCRLPSGNLRNAMPFVKPIFMQRPDPYNTLMKGEFYCRVRGRHARGLAGLVPEQARGLKKAETYEPGKAEGPAEAYCGEFPAAGFIKLGRQS